MRDIARAAGVRGRPLGPAGARRGSCARRSATSQLRALAAVGREPGLRRRAGRPVRRAAALARRARRASAPRSARGARRTRAAARGGARRALLGLPPAAGGARARVDADGLARAALDALRATALGRPAAVPLRLRRAARRAQLDARRDARPPHRHRGHASRCTYEPGRAALAGSAATVELLKPLAARARRRSSRARSTTPPSARGALHHLERGLFEAEPARASRPTAPCGCSRRAASAPRPSSSAPRCSSCCATAWRRRTSPCSCAGARRPTSSPRSSPSYGIPVARERRTPFAHTRLGTGVLAFARAALPGGTAHDVVTWLRTPGKLATAADLGRPRWTVARLRRARGRATAARGAAARGRGSAGATLDRARRARGRRGRGRRGRSSPRCWPRPRRSGPRRTSAAARRARRPRPRPTRARRAALRARGRASCTRLAAADPALAGGPQELLRGARRRRGPRAAPAAEGAPGVLLADPLAIRARRFRAVFVCGLQEGELPQRPQPEPFLDDGARVALAVASGLVLPRHEDTLARERSLFYACVSRPEEALFLSLPHAPTRRAGRSSRRRSSTTCARCSPTSCGPARPPAAGRGHLAAGRGADAARAAPRAGRAPSERAATRRRWPRPRDRAGAARCWPPATASPPAGWRRSPACPVQVAGRARAAGPSPVDPDPEPMQRGSLAHAVLERTLRGLKERTGSARLTPDTLADALRRAARGDRASCRRPPRDDARAKAAARALEVDLERYLRHEAATGARLRADPARVELRRRGDAPHDSTASRSAGASTASTSTAAGAIVRDYKGRTVHAGARWAEDGRIQAALYALAVRERLGLEVAGALYQPIGTRRPAPARPRPRRRPGPLRQRRRQSTPRRSTRGSTESRAIAAQAAADLRAGRDPPVPRPLRATTAAAPTRGSAASHERRPPSPPSSARRSRPAPARRCWPPTPARARPR